MSIRSSVLAKLVTAELITVKLAIAQLITACALVCAGPGVLPAQGYPAKPIRMVVPVAAGGSSDILGRLIGQRLAEQMGVSIFTDNRPGAAALVGSEVVAKAPADGYTLLTIGVEFTLNPSLRQLSFDPIRDFTCVAQLTTGQYFLSTHPSMPVTTARQFIALAKSRPGQLTFGSSGSGGLNHVAGVLFQQMTGTRL